MKQILAAAALISFVAVSAPALAAPASPVASADQAAIRAFLTRYYTSYKACDVWPGKTERCAEPLDSATAFTPEMRRAIARNIALNSGDVGAANGADPICGCQDYGTIRVTGMRFSRRPDGRVTTTIAMINMRPATRTLVMERTPAGWRVHDALEPGYDSYRTAILKENVALGKAKR